MIRLNLVKAARMKSFYPSGIGPRNIALYYDMKFDFQASFLSARTGIETLLSMIMTNSNSTSTTQLNYTTSNYDIMLFKLDQTFDFVTYFKDRITNYKPYFEMKACINSVAQKMYGTSIYKFWMMYIVWYNSPYIYNDDLYWNYTSPFSSITLYDTQGIKIYPNCTDNPITFYSTLLNPQIVDTVNNRKDLFTPDLEFNGTDIIFTMPFYINATSGEISNSTMDERIEKYYNPIKMVFNFVDPVNQLFLADGVKFGNYTSNNYFTSTSIHLTDFQLNYIENDEVGDVLPRLYFLQYPNLFGNVVSFILILAQLSQKLWLLSVFNKFGFLYSNPDYLPVSSK